MAETKYVDYGNLGNFMQDEYGNFGSSGITSPGDYRMKLREVIHDVMRVGRWYEVTSGRSLRGYRAIDVYIQIGSYPQPPQTEGAWYVLNLTLPPDSRPSIPPEHWYKVSHWVAYGQRHAIDQWYVKPIRARL